VSAPNAADLEMRRRIDERRSEGAKAWSPSAARELARRRAYLDVDRAKTDHDEKDAAAFLRDVESHLGSQDMFDTFCREEIGIALR
jgi:hypothetical protein